MRVSRTQAKQIIEDCIYWLEKRGVVLKDEREKRTVSVPPEGLEQLRELLKKYFRKRVLLFVFERRKYIVFKLHKTILSRITKSVRCLKSVGIPVLRI